MWFYAAIKLLLTSRSICNSFIWSCKSICMMFTQYVNITPLLKFVSHTVCVATVHSDDWSAEVSSDRILGHRSEAVFMVTVPTGIWSRNHPAQTSMCTCHICVEECELHLLYSTHSTQFGCILFWSSGILCCVAGNLTYLAIFSKHLVF
jgi:hypothetical protein